MLYRYNVVFVVGSRAQQELVVKEQREDGDRKKKNLAYADDVRGQIREKEQGRIADRNAFFQEGVKMEDEARKRRMKLDEVKTKKLNELRLVIGVIRRGA